MSRTAPLLASLALAAPLALLPAAAAHAQSSAAQILEQARGQARDIEALRKILNGPDQNMRLATFDGMVKSGDEAMKLIALEAGLASADSVMRAMAFKAVVMGLDNLHLTLQPDPSAPKPVQEASAAFILKRGSGLVVPMDGRGKNLEAGSFSSGGWEGQVSGLELMFGYGRSVSGTMTLQDDNALAGVVRAESGTTQFLAGARLR